LNKELNWDTDNSGGDNTPEISSGKSSLATEQYNWQ
jgi:hypothetical protein